MKEEGRRKMRKNETERGMLIQRNMWNERERQTDRETERQRESERARKRKREGKEWQRQRYDKERKRWVKY